MRKVSVGKIIDDFGKDVREGLKGGIPNVAREILKDCADITPVLSGRLQASGFAYVNDRLVARSSEWYPHPRATQPKALASQTLSGRGGKARGKSKNIPWTISIMFSTPKLAKENANFYYTEGGQKWFDYAVKRHEKGDWNIGSVVEQKMMETSVEARILWHYIDRELKK